MKNGPVTDKLTANDNLINRAFALLAQRKLVEVAELLNQAQKNNDQDPRIFMLGARLAEDSGKPAEAVETMEHACALAPDWWPAQLEYGLLLARLDRYQAALQQAEKIFALESTQRMALAGVVDIATRCGDTAAASRYVEHALRVYPDDPVLLMHLGSIYYFSQNYEQALKTWDRLLELQPDHARALYGRVNTLVQMGRAEEAEGSAERLLASDPDNAIYQYFSKIVSGQTPATQPAELQQQLFDSLAEHYDLRMVRLLRYELPEQIATRLLELFPDRKFNLLDLGCGSGLLGVFLGRIDGAMVGVDVSEKMLEQAARHQVYNRFHKVNLLDAVRDTPGELYEVITALDVLPYVGDMTPIISNVHRILQPEGFFFFSTEAAPAGGPGMVLQNNGRYAHSRAELERLLAHAGFAMATIEEKTIRLEAGKPVKGFVAAAQKGR